MYCLTQLYHSRDMYRIYYIKNYMFRHFTLALFRLINEKKLSKQIGVYVLSNTTIWWRYIYVLLHRELHVSALDNGHLQVVYETLSKQLYKTCTWATYMGQGGGKVGTRSLGNNMDPPRNPHHPTFRTDMRSRAYFPPSLPYISSPRTCFV